MAAQGEQLASDSDASAWRGTEDNMDDPEEVKVVFCALDSFSYVCFLSYTTVTFG